MKKCPNCQKTYSDDKRFCQLCGAALIDEMQVPEDPFKTVVVGKSDIPNISEEPMKTTVNGGDTKDDDILQIPETFDPMKTVVVSEPIRPDKPEITPPTSEPAPELPKFNEPDLSPPNFGNLLQSQSPVVDAPKVEPPPIKPPAIQAPTANPFGEPPKIENPLSEPINAKVEPPVPKPVGDAPKVNEPKLESTPFPGSPFDAPKSEPMQSSNNPFETPPFREPEPAFNPPPSPFDPTPFGENQAVGQPEWIPAPAPGDDWQNQVTPIQPSGQSSTLAIISLIAGVVSLLSVFGLFIPFVNWICTATLWILAIAAIITGFLGRGRAKNNPEQFGGAGLALLGIITGTLSILAFVGLILLVVLFFGGVSILGGA